MNPKKPVFVVFEGLDGSGKTTSARKTTELLGATYVTTPTPELRRFRDDIIASFHGNQEAAQLFYLATVFAASHDIARMLAGGVSVVLDRYFVSTQAYAEFRGSKLALDHLGDELLRPDLTVYLDASLEVRRARVGARGEESAADRETLRPDADATLRRLHLKRSTLGVVGKWLNVDTSAIEPGDVARRVVSAILIRG